MTVVRTTLPATLAALVLACGLHAQPCLAQSPPPAASQAPSQSSPPLDIMVALDNSGSMKRNDPNALMRSAVSEFAKRLAPGSRFGIVVFDTKASVVLGLTPADGAGFAEQINGTLARVDYAGQWTDIAGGVEQAMYELREHGREGAQRAIVIFTDGMVETGNPTKDVDRARWLQGSLAQEAKDKGIRLYGIAFTSGADFQLMQSVAQTTGGEHFRVLAAADIAGVFEQIRPRAAVAASAPATVAAPPAARPATVADQRQTWGYLSWSMAFTALVAAATAVWLARRSSGAGAGPGPGPIPIPAPTVAASLRDVVGHSGWKVTPLRKAVLRIGRDPKLNDLVLPFDTVSSGHAVIEFRQETFYVRDLRSVNGTFVNGRRIGDSDSIQEAPLKHEDAVRFDAYEFEFSVDNLAGATQTRLSPQAGDIARRQRSRVDLPLTPPPRAEDTIRDVPVSVSTAFLERGNCYVHPSAKAIAICPRCKLEKCAKCIPVRDGMAVCVQCAHAGR